MAAWIVGQIRRLVDSLEVSEMPMQVARHHDVRGIANFDEAALTAGRLPNGIGGFVQSSQQSVGVRHKSSADRDSRKADGRDKRSL